MRKILLLLLMMLSVSVLAVDQYPLDTPKQQAQFSRLSKQMRCLVCQNESLADSSAPLAIDLRKKIYHQVQAGKSDSQIVKYMVNRYGQFVLFKPPMQQTTWLLWFGPFIIMLIGFVVVAKMVIRSRPKNSDAAED